MSKGIGGQVGSRPNSSKGIGGQTGSRSSNNNNTNSTSGDCFVATVAFRTPWASEIQELRNFRDKTLRRYTIGRKFISFYYTYGPSLAKVVERNKYTMKIVRGLIKGSIILVKKSQRGE